MSDSKSIKRGKGSKRRRLETMVINVVGDRIEITDYSSSDARRRVVALLSALGVKSVDLTESWCG